MSMPFPLYSPPVLFDTPMILYPRRLIRRAALEPTLPEPWMITRVWSRFIRSLLRASSQTIINPRPVASLRPFEPPNSSGFPVTTAVTVWRTCME